MRTRLTELLGIEYPIVQAGMGYVSYPELVAAVSNAGGLGILTAAMMDADQLRAAIHRTRDLSHKPFGVNLVQFLPKFQELVEVVVQERVPVASFGLGPPPGLMRQLKSYGIINMPTVGNLKQAIRMEEEGADAVVVTGEAGGGHVSRVATIVLVPVVVDKVQIPVVAGGGFCDGRGLAAALALGAEGIYMGTRFVTTQESPVPLSVKKRYLEATENDTVISDYISGRRARYLRNKLIETIERRGSGATMMEKVAGSWKMRRMYKDISIWELLTSGFKLRKAYERPLGELLAGFAKGELSYVKGDADEGSITAGQVVGLINDLPTCEELIQRIVKEAEAVSTSVKEKVFAQGTSMDGSPPSPL